jgi:EAL and modified HD-GYP domain-containing signal transduction protein
METHETINQAGVTGPECFLGRQPIYDCTREIRAYELLYRRNLADVSASFSSGDQASARVVLKAFLEIGLPTVSPEQPVFINHTAALLAVDPLVPPDRCVIEVLEDVEANPETIACLVRLKKLGYRIALDDFTYSDVLAPFVRLADYVKLDLRALSTAELHSHVKLLKEFGVMIVAEKVESEQEFEESVSLGCDLFQGYYLRKPEVLSGRRIPANRLSALSLLAECIGPDKSATTIAAVLARDATLVYGVLRLANSALYSHTVQIQSPAQAVLMLGMDRVFQWASLLVLSGCDDSPVGYLEFALQRARACEIVAEAYGGKPQLAYMAGLLSTLDSILNAPLPDIILPLPLDGLFKRAILQREGELGSVLDAVLGYEAGSFETATRHGFSIHQVQSAFWEAAAYSASMVAELRIVTTNYAR